MKEILPDNLSANALIRTLSITNVIFGRENRYLTNLDITKLEDFYYLICDWLKEVTEDLPEREKDIFAMRLGIGEFDRDHTLEEVAEKFKVTRERVRQIDQRNIARLRHPDKSSKLRAKLNELELWRALSSMMERVEAGEKLDPKFQDVMPAYMEYKDFGNRTRFMQNPAYKALLAEWQ